MATDAAKPRLAATVMLLRDGPGGIEVLMLEKAAGGHFAGGALVFPGGKVDPLDETFEGPMGEPRHALSAFKIAAVRELFEECGIMLARRAGAGDLMSEAELAECRAAAPSAAFFDLASSACLELATEKMVHFAHWITPPARPVRFDTHFFIAAMPEGQATVTVDGHEIVDANWRRPSNILAEVYADKLKMVLPTMMNLHKLGLRRTVEDALATARNDKVVCVVPNWVEGSPLVTIPAEAGYGMTTIETRLVRKA
jgi:8-oxo-dGTP pyrophosphatase MutT (NUDIX family)